MKFFKNQRGRRLQRRERIYLTHVTTTLSDCLLVCNNVALHALSRCITMAAWRIVAAIVMVRYCTEVILSCRGITNSLQGNVNVNVSVNIYIAHSYKAPNSLKYSLKLKLKYSFWSQLPTFLASCCRQFRPVYCCWHTALISIASTVCRYLVLSCVCQCR